MIAWFWLCWFWCSYTPGGFFPSMVPRVEVSTMVESILSRLNGYISRCFAHFWMCLEVYICSSTGAPVGRLLSSHVVTQSLFAFTFLHTDIHPRFPFSFRSPFPRHIFLQPAGSIFVDARFRYWCWCEHFKFHQLLGEYLCWPPFSAALFPDVVTISSSSTS